MARRNIAPAQCICVDENIFEKCKNRRELLNGNRCVKNDVFVLNDAIYSKGNTRAIVIIPVKNTHDAVPGFEIRILPIEFTQTQSKPARRRPVYIFVGYLFVIVTEVDNTTSERKSLFGIMFVSRQNNKKQ